MQTLNQTDVRAWSALDPKSVWVGNVHPDTSGDPRIAAAQNVLYSTCYI